MLFVKYKKELFKVAILIYCLSRYFVNHSIPLNVTVIYPVSFFLLLVFADLPTPNNNNNKH